MIDDSESSVIGRKAERTRRNFESDNADTDDAVLPTSPFVTTSDIIGQLNKHLSEVSTQDNTESFQQQPCFELQKRLPDGSAVPATQDETAAADFKTKLEQSAKFVSELESSEDRQYWAEQQRLTGNIFFQKGDYKGAMDIYLTCLVVKENTPGFLRDTFLPVLNNLAQCTLQLGMHSKTILFCTMALDEISRRSSQENDTNEKRLEKEEMPGNDRLAFARKDLTDAIALSKIFFKQAKALRLTGYYAKSRDSLNNSLDCLSGKGHKLYKNSTVASVADDEDVQLMFAPYKKAINKEFLHLDTAEKEAKRNRIRQKKAMQTVLSSSKISASHSSSSQSVNRGIQSDSSSSRPLYGQSTEAREFSQLRARKSSSRSPHNTGSNEHIADDSRELSYTQYYWNVIGRVAKALLAVLGDHEHCESEEFSNKGKKRS